MENLMKTLTHLMLVAGLVGVPLLAAAEDSPLSGNIGLSSDYIFRGISQTQHKPEISGGFDYAHPSGLYVGTWLSNQDWVSEGDFKDNSSLEVDLYGGYRSSLPADVGYDVGVITYYYPGNKIAGAHSPDTTEIYGSLSWKFLTLKDSYTVSKNFIGWYGTGKSRGSNYLELNANYDLGDGWGVLGHVGHQKVKNFSDASYTDWKVGASKDIGYGTVTLAYSNTNADEPTYTVPAVGGHPKDLSKGVAILSFSKSF
jgi:uncharacterized protein (TIGR02001 family)